MKQSEYTFEKVWQMFQETDKQFKETDKKLRSLETLFTGQWGRLIEALVEGELVKLLKERGISVEQTYERQKKRVNDRDYEFDIVAKNGKDVVLVEVKTALRPEDVQDFMENLNVIKEVFPEYKSNTVYGAVAFLRCEAKADVFAMREGLFVIRAVGDSASILNPATFQPKNF